MIEWALGLMMLMFLCASPAFAVPGAAEVRAGNDAYSKKDYSRAFEKYEAAAVKAPQDPRVDFDLGAAAYKTEKYRDAVDFLNKALLADDPKLAKDAHYNLGNAFYKAGVWKEDKDIGGAIKDLEQGIAHYEKAIAADSKDQDAKGNREFVVSELERLRKKQKEQQQQQLQQQGQQQKDQQGQQQNQQQAQQQKQDEPSARQQGQKQEGQKPENPEGQGQQKQDEAQKQGASAGQADKEPILSQDEANMLLDDFAQNEQTRGLLNFERTPRQERPVGKDW